MRKRRFLLSLATLSLVVLMAPAARANPALPSQAFDCPNCVPIDSELLATKIISQPQPVYPEPARQANIAGDVELHAIIGKDGTIIHLEAVSGHPLLVQAALDAVKQWRYMPTLVNGDPVEVDTTITIPFALDGTAAPAMAETKQDATFDPLKAYVGTWVATNPNESNPFLVLRLSEVNGGLSGTISHFTIGGIRNGGPVWSPLTYAETPISDVRTSDSGLDFTWSGDPPFHGGEMDLRAEGNNVAYINIPISMEESEKIFADHWGLGYLFPTILLHREGEVGSEGMQNSSVDDWKVLFAARLINQAEFQYRFDTGKYADYITLLHSGQLKRASGHWTVVTIDLNSETDPLPGYDVRLTVSRDGESYKFSIVRKTSAECAPGYDTDEKGVVVISHVAECSVN
jgi:TonB family protein